jgi:hypothetical protein
MQPDALDESLTQMYGMSVFHYDRYYIGFLLLYHPTPYHEIFGNRVSSLASHKFIDGHVECQLAYSMNGWHFQRGLRDTFIGKGEPGEPDFGCAYPSSLIRKNDELIIYASIGSHEHGRTPAGSGAIAAYRLREDGFVHLESVNGFGQIGTRCLWWNSGELFINVVNPTGEIIVQITDEAGRLMEGYSFAECIPYSGDNLNWSPIWTSGKKMSELAGEIITIEIYMRGTRLYAIKGDFIPLIVPQIEKFKHFGTIPERILGF